jgi:hypothetical protein
MNPDLMHQMAQDRRAELLRKSEAYRRAGLTARPTAPVRITAWIPRLPINSRRRRARVAMPSAPGRTPRVRINLLKEARLRRKPLSPYRFSRRP